jgi:hypothetical protein
MFRRRSSRWIVGIASLFAVACATHQSTTRGDKPAAAKKAPGCDNFASPCSAEEACIDGACRPRACSSDGDCGGTAACIEGACIARQCQENLGCLGDDQTAGTDDDRSCVGGVCLPLSCPRDGNRCPAPGKERCNFNSDCGFGRICFGGTCVAARCAQDKDCLPRLCYVGLCYDQECNDRKRCKSGKTCVNGLCLVAGASAN